MKKYPKYVMIKGEKHYINTDFRVALKCFDIINDPNIGDMERTYAVVYKLFGFIPDDEDMAQYVHLAEKYLGCGKTQEEQHERTRDLDFNHDWSYLVASFRSDYNINLNEVDNMHWYEFIDLIQGLTSKTIMSRVRELRNYDMSEVKDAKTRSKILRAKESVALPVELSEEEEKGLEEFESLFK